MCEYISIYNYVYNIYEYIYRYIYRVNPLPRYVYLSTVSIYSSIYLSVWICVYICVAHTQTDRQIEGQPVDGVSVVMLGSSR